MSKFLNNLSDLVYKCYDGVASDAPLPDVECTYDRLELIREKLESLGDNARRMLEIGIVQDELVKLGFELFNHNGYGADIDKMRLFGTARFEIVFHPTSVFLYHIPPLSEKQAKYTKLDISYNSTKWQDNVINKVKELIK